MIHVGVKSAALAMTLACGVAFAQTDTRVESSRAVKSPSGTKTVVVDRLTPVVDGEAERFSGRMLIRVTNADGTQARQRYLEASQVRVIQPPVWLDDSRTCAFVYNVAKNSNGIVYYEPETNRAVQVEFVMPTRQMAASGSAEQELTSLEVTEFSGTRTMKTLNVPWKGGSAFPLVLPPLPEFLGQPYDLTFLNQLNAALDGYRAFLEKHKISNIEPEQASESFSDDNKWLGMLACSDAGAFLAGVPLTSTDPVTVLNSICMVKMDGIMLSCTQHTAADAPEQHSMDNRYLTAWENGNTLKVIEESYAFESEEPIITTKAKLNVETCALDVQTTASTAAATTAPGVMSIP